MGLSYINYNDHAQTFSTIELELHLTENSYGKFINMEEGKEKYYHIFFGKIYINEKGKKYKNISYNEKEAKKDYIDENEQVDIIKIIIEHQIESFMELFYEIDIIKKIKFSKFWRNNINNMSDMFGMCTSLIKI